MNAQAPLHTTYCREWVSRLLTCTFRARSMLSFFVRGSL